MLKDVVVNEDACEIFVPGVGLADCECDTSPFGLIVESELGLTLSFEGSAEDALAEVGRKFGFGSG